MVDENYKIEPGSSKHVFSFKVMGNDDRQKIALVLQHVNWEQALELYLARPPTPQESSSLLDSKAQSMPIDVFVLEKDIAQELHHQLGMMLQVFDEGDS